MFWKVVLLLMLKGTGVLADNLACNQNHIGSIFVRLSTLSKETDDQIRSLQENIKVGNTILSSEFDKTNRRIDQLKATMDTIKANIEKINKILELDECASNPCVNNATCVDGVNLYSCKCLPGYKGTNCQIETNECASNPCVNNATCVDGKNRYSCRCLPGYDGTNCEITVKDCMALREIGLTENGIYSVHLSNSVSPIQVYCDMQTNDGGWTIFQNRFNGLLDFNRNFSDYENGFGDLNGEFWIGLKFVQEMVSLGPTELRLDVSAVDSTTFYSVFQNFSLGSDNNYTLNIGARSGSVPNRPDRTLAQHNGRCFSTYDRDCGKNSCAMSYKGGWWFNTCFVDGVYFNGVYTNYGINHFGFIEYTAYSNAYNLRSSRMMFRRKEP